jgi:TolA-binding protein
LSDLQNDSLARHVRVETSEARVDRLWSGVSAGLAAPRPFFKGRSPPRRIWSAWTLARSGAALFALATVALVAVRAVRPPSAAETSAWEGARLETNADALSVTLVDGSKLKLDPASRVEFGNRTATAVKLLLVRGRIACDVTHQPGRSFVVSASGVDVRVVGTRFSVSTEQNPDTTRVEVQVERGVVEVRGTGSSAATVRVEAGRSWSQITRSGLLSKEPAAAPSIVPPSAGVVPRRVVAAGPASVTAPAVIAPPPSVVNPPGGRALRSTGVADARRVLERARDQWRNGRIRDAAAAYQTLLSRYPHDPRAGLAAFELGRLRMDRLGDMPGAVQALEQAVVLAPSSGFREDAMARLVAANAGARDAVRCARARDQYLAEYPGGVHQRAVSAACGAR